MPVLVLKIEYDGTNYCGWQRQANAITVQETIESAICKIFGEKAAVTAAGRTDTGVHARGMTAHVNIAENRIADAKLLAALNAYLPEDIYIKNAKFIEGRFHARFDANGREYSYTITKHRDIFQRNYSWHLKYPFEYEKLQEIAAIFSGKHDFTTFSKWNPSTESYICEIEKCEWNKLNDGRIVLRIKADRFVYGMVRSLVGVMTDYARGKRSYEDIKMSLESRDRSRISPMAPAKGLVFEKAYYPEELKQAIEFL